MSVLLDQNTPGLEEAAARLAELETNEPADTRPPVSQEQRETPAEAGGSDRAAAGEGKDNQNPTEKTTDTPAAPDAKKPGADKSPDNQDGKTGEPKPGEKAKSNFAKSQERLEKTWEGVNKRKGELDTREQQLTQKERDLQQREQQFKAQAEQSQAQYKPEDVDRAAGQKLARAKALNQQADGLEARAKKLQDDGNYTEAAKAEEEAKKLRKQANKEEGNAEDLKAHAEQLRKNPPPSFKQQEEKLNAQRKEWTTKAASEFPDLAKQNSPLQAKVAQALNQLWNDDRALASHPQIIYHVTRLCAAETAAARVPELEKQLGELKAKVQDYEKLTSPGGPGAAQRADTAAQPKSDADERAELGELAASMGSIR